MSSKAGPSKSKTPKVAKAAVPAVAAAKNLSNENVESDDDLESRDQGDDDYPRQKKRTRMRIWRIYNLSKSLRLRRIGIQSNQVPLGRMSPSFTGTVEKEG